jgi:hypothetical protein
MSPRSAVASVLFSHEPEGTSFRILADSEVVSGMDYGAFKLDHSLKRARHVIHNEVRQRECVARPGPAFMDTYLGRIGTSLPTFSFATLASLELNVQHSLPESEGALRVVGWKLDEGDGRAIHATTLAAVEASRFIGMAQNETPGLAPPPPHFRDAVHARLRTPRRLRMG